MSLYQERIAPVFDVAEQGLLVEYSDDGFKQTKVVNMPSDSPEAKVRHVAGLGARTLICGAICRPTLLLAETLGLQVYDFISGKMEEILRAHAENRLRRNEAFHMPGCGNRQRCGQGRGHGRRWRGSL